MEFKEKANKWLIDISSLTWNDLSKNWKSNQNQSLQIYELENVKISNNLEVIFKIFINILYERVFSKHSAS